MRCLLFGRGDSRIEKRGVLRMSTREARAKFLGHAPFFAGHTHLFLIIRIVILIFPVSTERLNSRVS